MGAPGAATDSADACGVDACCVEHPVTRALASATFANDVAYRMEPPGIADHILDARV